MANHKTHNYDYHFNMYVKMGTQDIVEKIAVELGMTDVRGGGYILSERRPREWLFDIKPMSDLNTFSMMLGALMKASVPVRIEVFGQPIVASTLADAAQLVRDLKSQVDIRSNDCSKPTSNPNQSNKPRAFKDPQLS